MGVGADGQPQGPHPRIHILPCPYYTRLGGPIRRIVGASGERMRWVGHVLDKSALYSGRPSGVLISLFEMYAHEGCHYISTVK